MTNTVEIRVTVNDGAVAAELAGIETATRASTGRQKSMWDNLGAGITTGLGNSLKGIGGLAAGALGIGLSGPLAAAGLAVAGFAALAIPTFDKVSKALSTTGTAGQKAYEQLDPSQRSIYQNVKQLESGFDSLAKSFEPVVSSVVMLASHVAIDLEPAIAKLAPAGAAVVNGFLVPFDALLKSPFFGQFISQMSQLATQVAPLLGQTLVELLKVFMQMFMQAGPAAIQVLNQLLPAIVQIAQGLIPVVAGVTKLVAVTVDWLAQNHLLIPALAAVGLAIAVMSGGILPAIAGIALLVGALVHMYETSKTFRDIVLNVFSVVGQAMLTFVELTLDDWRTFVDILMNAAHGALDAAYIIAKAIDFVMGTHLADGVRSAQASMASFKTSVDNTFDAAHAKIEGWKTDLANMPKKVTIEGDITDLTAKLNSAESQLKDPNLTATRRAQVEANIAQLQAALAQARLALDALNGKTVNTYVVNYQINPSAGAPFGGKASGGIIGAAGGGARGNMVMVGEHGRELVSLPAGSTVHSNPDTEGMLGQGGSNGLHITLELGNSFKQAGLTEQQLEDIRYTVRTKGGGNAQAVFGRN